MKKPPKDKKLEIVHAGRYGFTSISSPQKNWNKQIDAAKDWVDKMSEVVGLNVDPRPSSLANETSYSELLNGKFRFMRGAGGGGGGGE